MGFRERTTRVPTSDFQAKSRCFRGGADMIRQKSFLFWGLDAGEISSCLGSDTRPELELILVSGW